MSRRKSNGPKVDHLVEGLVTKMPNFGFVPFQVKPDSNLERVVVTNLYDTKIWSEKSHMFVPESKHLPQFTVHSIKACSIAAKPDKLFYNMKKDFPQKHIAWVVVPFGPEKIKNGHRQKIVNAATENGYEKLRLITFRDALFMGVAYALNVDMPSESLCLFVIVNEEDFVVTLYDRYETGYLPRLLWIVPYDVEHPEAAINRLEPLARFLQRVSHIRVAVYEKEAPFAILKEVFGDGWFSAPTYEPDAFYRQHLCIAGGVVKGRNLIGVKDMNYWNVIETCPYEYQVRDANDAVLTEFFVPFCPLPLGRDAKVSATSGLLRFYCRDFPSENWVQLRSFHVNPSLETVCIHLTVDIHCGYKLFIDGIDADIVNQEVCSVLNDTGYGSLVVGDDILKVKPGSSKNGKKKVNKKPKAKDPKLGVTCHCSEPGTSGVVDPPLISPTNTKKDENKSKKNKPSK